MKLIKREMQSEEPIEDKTNYYSCCQASINSDGNITLRNYDRKSKNSDEIIILSQEETAAIFRLLEKIKNYDTRLPF